MISEIFFSLLAKKLMDRHFFYCYWLKIDTEKIALPGERSQTQARRKKSLPAKDVEIGSTIGFPLMLNRICLRKNLTEHLPILGAGNYIIHAAIAAILGRTFSHSRFTMERMANACPRRERLKIRIR